MRLVFLAALLPRLALAQDLVIEGATVWTAKGPPLEGATVVVREGRIASVGVGIEVPAGLPRIEAAGRALTPGFIDVHSHMGVYAWPGGNGSDDGNEATDPLTPQVWAGDSVHVYDPAFERARAGGITTVQILPGSANLVGGESAILKLRPSRTLAGMLFEGAPRGIKMACGENPKRVYAKDEDGPSTRMGNLANMRAGFQAALDYREARKRREPPPRDLGLEELLDVIDGKVRVHVHCYRGDDIEGIYRVMDQFGVHVSSFQHSIEAYKVRDLIAAHGTGIATWPDWWGFKLEAYDQVPENAVLVKHEGVPVAIHSDSADMIQRFPIEGAKLLRYGATEQEAMEMITLDPARILGLEARVGSIEVGKDADLVLMSGDPFDAYSLVDLTFIDGVLVYDRAQEGSPGARGSPMAGRARAS